MIVVFTHLLISICTCYFKTVVAFIFLLKLMNGISNKKNKHSQALPLCHKLNFIIPITLQSDGVTFDISKT